MDTEPKTPPHPVLKRYYASEDERRQRVNALFDAAARDYDQIEHGMSFGRGRWYRRQALQRIGVAAGMHVLDVGCGTGVIAAEAIECMGSDGQVVALDPSRGMLGEARARNVLRVVQGVSESLPFADRSFDRLIMGYALRHVSDLGAAFREFHRVLRPGGTLLLLEIAMPQSRINQALLKFYLKYLVPTATRFFSRSRESSTLMSYYWETIESCVPPSVILDALVSAGFSRCQRQVGFGVFSDYTAIREDELGRPGSAPCYSTVEHGKSE